jgi:hypothetical protein
MKIYELDKARQRTGNTREVPELQWKQLQKHWGKKLRWEADPVVVKPPKYKKLIENEGE